MIDRFLTGIANAHGFLAKLWVLARPYWFTHERSTIRLGGLVFTIKEAWIGRAVLALIISLSVLWFTSPSSSIPGTRASTMRCRRGTPMYSGPSSRSLRCWRRCSSSPPSIAPG
jgi:hypothetical protein